MILWFVGRALNPLSHTSQGNDCFIFKHIKMYPLLECGNETDGGGLCAGHSILWLWLTILANTLLSTFVQMLLLCPRCQADNRGCMSVPSRAVLKILPQDTWHQLLSCSAILSPDSLREPGPDPDGQAANTTDLPCHPGLGLEEKRSERDSRC